MGRNQQPPPTRKQEMMKSVAEDEEELFVNLKGLENAGDGLLADLSEPVDSPIYPANNRTEASTLLSPGWAQPSTSSSKNQLEPSNEQPARWRAEGSNAYAQFVKRTTVSILETVNHVIPHGNYYLLLVRTAFRLSENVFALVRDGFLSLSQSQPLLILLRANDKILYIRDGDRNRRWSLDH
jgi:hypothetical protein